MIIDTIKDLYEWAVKNEVENLQLFVCDEGGMATNCYTEEIYIDEEGILL